MNHHQAFPGPLMRKNVQKKNLIHFIVHQAQNCLSNNNMTDRVEEYFFWRIVELFCRQNGNVMMSQIAIVLLKDYHLFRRKSSNVKGADEYKQWCLPLAQLLVSFAPEHELRESVIKMGDDLEIKELTYAAHICFMVGRLDLGSRDQFHLIGCKSFPFGLRILRSAVIRTEIYEFVLWLTSGLVQPHFQVFKLCHTSRLAISTRYLSAFEYCEVIARAIISHPGSYQRTFLKRVISLSSDVQKKLEEETEPEWLQQLHRLHQIKVANAKTEANCDPAHLVSSNSSAMGSEDQDSECGTATDKIAVPHFQISEVDLDRRYTMGDLLGKGSFGFVFDGVRNKDYKPVAIKTVLKKFHLRFLKTHHCMDNVPAEVALMQKVCEPPCCSNIVKLIEWIDTPAQFYIILENPSPCMNLEKFAERQDGRLTETQTRGIVLQVIRAAQHCCARGVLHRDIKAQNILINTETLEIKLIDFGCGDWLKDTPYTKFSGTPALWPPEWVINKEYNGIPATVWGLGILTFGLLCGDYPFYLEDELDDGCLDLIPGVSRDVLDLIMWCLELNPDLRPSFEDLLGHEWFTEGVEDEFRQSGEPVC